jgi:hypothetical protein
MHDTTDYADAPQKHHLPTLFQRPDRLRDPLYVVAPVYNPHRYRSRWRLYEDFAKMCDEAGAILYTVEVAFGDRLHAITSYGEGRHIQLRTSAELWFKENAINVGVSRLPADWKYVAWVDADTMFARDDWANETLHALQHFACVQMWSQYQNLSDEHELLGTAAGFVHNYLEGVPVSPAIDSYGYGHKRGYPGAPGLAWACRREAWETVGGLLDCCILGAGDWYMAHALVGRLNDKSLSSKFHPSYRREILQWAARASRLHANVGVVRGLALHHWHGPKARRRYGSREQILIDGAFDPRNDLHRDWQGLYQLHVHDARTATLRDRIRQYFGARNEDAPASY